MAIKHTALAVGSALLLTLVACGDAANNSDFPANDTTQTSPNGNGGSFGQGGSSGGQNGLPIGAPNDLARCATSSAAAEGQPVYLVFMFDKSGSMVKDKDGKDSPKWSACKAATEAFFESPTSAGVSASLQYFPLDRNNDSSCVVGDYEAPAVSMSTLPNNAFRTSLEAQDPDGGTPTAPALKGALGYARTVAAGQGQDGKVAVVLVTDGDPNDCSSSVNAVSKIASDAAADIPTYVIGIGSVKNLNTIAQAGGTKQATVVPVDDPAKIEGDFRKAIEAIRLEALSCEYKIPAPPTGETFDRDRVNVLYTAQGAAPASVDYNPTCAGGTGWRYDNEAQPSRVVFCETSCGGIKAQAGKVDIVFGCQTHGSNVK